MNDLELVSTQDLVEEIFRRHEYSLVCGGGPSKDGSEGRWLFRWKGSSHSCLGATTHMATVLMGVLMNSGRTETGISNE